MIHCHESVGGNLCTATSFPFLEGRGPLYSVLAAEFQSPLGESNSSTKNHRRHRLTLPELEFGVALQVTVEALYDMKY